MTGESVISPAMKQGMIPLAIPLSKNSLGLYQILKHLKVKYYENNNLLFTVSVSRFCNRIVEMANCSAWVKQVYTFAPHPNLCGSLHNLVSPIQDGDARGGGP